MPASLWKTKVEGDVYKLRADPDRILAWTGKGCIALDLQGRWLWNREGSTPLDLLAGEGSRLDLFGPKGIGRGLRVGSVVFSLEQGKLRRFDRDGKVTLEAELSADVFSAYAPIVARGLGGPKDECDEFIRWWRTGYMTLLHDIRRDRLIAFTVSHPASVLALTFDGTVQWLTFLGLMDCCNDACFVEPDGVLAHLASCARRLDFMDHEGHVALSTPVEPSAVRVIDGGDNHVYVVVLDYGVAAYDTKTARLVWRAELPNLSCGAVRGGILYGVFGTHGNHNKIAAFELGRLAASARA
jgi:hypothetical protein